MEPDRIPTFRSEEKKPTKEIDKDFLGDRKTRGVVIWKFRGKKVYFQKKLGVNCVK